MPNYLGCRCTQILDLTAVFPCWHADKQRSPQQTGRLLFLSCCFLCAFVFLIVGKLGRKKKSCPVHFSFSSFLFFWPRHKACGILVPWPAIERGPQQWKRRVLTTGLPGNFPQYIFLKFAFCSLFGNALISPWKYFRGENKKPRDLHEKVANNF